MKSLASPFIDEDASIGRAGTVVTADWLNSVQDELAAMITRFGGTLDSGDTQIADLVEDWRARGDCRAALEWREVSTMMISGSILWAGNVANEPICITSTLEVLRITGSDALDRLGTLMDGVVANEVAVLDGDDGAFRAAVVDSDKMLRLFDCRISGGAYGTTVAATQRWSIAAHATVEGYITLSIDAAAIWAVKSRDLGGMVELNLFAHALDDGEPSSVTVGYIQEEPESLALPAAICGAPAEAPVVVLHGAAVERIDLGVLDPLSSDSSWQAVEGARRVRWFEGVARACLWSSGSPNVWIGDPAGHAQSMFPWRRVALPGLVLDLLESNGALIALSVGDGALLCHRLTPSGDLVFLTSTPAPGFSPSHSDVFRRRAFAAITQGIVWGHGYGYLFASADVRQGFRVTAAKRGTDAVQHRLLTADLGGRALMDTMNGPVVSRMF